MAWIESHQSLGTHLKLKRLARELNVHRAQAIGHLHFLWWWSLDNAPSGDLSALSSVELAEVSEWPGNADKFAAALKACGWVDADGMIHEWMQYAGRLVEEREQAKHRMKLYREKQKANRNGNSDVQDRYSNVPVTNTERAELPNPTQPNPTVPNPTNTDSGQPPAPRERASVERPRFIPPSREELNLEAAKLGLPDAEVDRFVAYYGSNGWRVGKNPMKSWPHALAGWAARWRNPHGHGISGAGAHGAATPAERRNQHITGADAIQRQAELTAERERRMAEEGRLPL